MAEYVSSPYNWVRKQVELYESSGGTEGTTLLDTGLPVILVTHTGNKTGAIRKTPLMRVTDGDRYVLVGSQGGRPKDPEWVHNLRANPNIELRDKTVVRSMRTHEVTDAAERAPVDAGGCRLPALRRIPGAHDARHPGVRRGSLSQARTHPRLKPQAAPSVEPIGLQTVGYT